MTLEPDRFRLVSVDLFDTLLLRRRAWPGGVFQALGRAAAARGLVESGITPVLFAALRERAARVAEAEAGHARVVTLADIYRHLPAGLIDCTAVQALEVEIESEGGVLNPFVTSLIETLVAAGQPVVAASDMYLGRAALETLLARAGFNLKLLRDIYVSCEIGATKRDGGLFRRLLADYPELAPGEICHIGDDPVGDDLVPGRLGLHRQPYGIPPALRRILERERTIGGGGEFGTDPARVLAARLNPACAAPTLAASRGQEGLDREFAKGEPESLEFWFRFGALIVAPVLVAYSVFVVEECRRRGIPRILAFLREGRLLALLMDAYARQRGYRMTIAPLAVSRQALGRTEVPRWDRAGLQDLFERRPYLKLGDLLIRTGESPPAPLAALSGQPLERLIDHRLADGTLLLEALITWFNAPAPAAALAGHAADARHLTEQFLAAAIGEAPAVALVDLGARATTAAAIWRLDAIRARTRLHAFLLYATDGVTEALAAGVPLSLFGGDDPAVLSHGRLLYRSPQPVERLLTGLEDATTGYQEAPDGTVQPVREPTAASGAERAAILAVEAGVIAYWRLWALLSPPGASAAGGTAGDQGTLPWRAMLHLPFPEEAQRLGSLLYDYNDGSAWVRTICDDSASAAVGPLLARRGVPLTARLLGLRPTVVPWPQGTLTRLDPLALTRLHDALAIDPGHRAQCTALAATLAARGLTRVLVFAAGGPGGMGGPFIEAAQAVGIAVNGYLDHFPQMVDHLFHGIPVVTLDQLAARPPGMPGMPGMRDPIVVVTLGFRDPMLRSLARVIDPEVTVITLEDI